MFKLLQKALLICEVNYTLLSVTMTSGRPYRPYTLNTWLNSALAVSMAVGRLLRGTSLHGGGGSTCRAF